MMHRTSFICRSIFSSMFLRSSRSRLSLLSSSLLLRDRLTLSIWLLLARLLAALVGLLPPPPPPPPLGFLAAHALQRLGERDLDRLTEAEEDGSAASPLLDLCAAKSKCTLPVALPARGFGES